MCGIFGLVINGKSGFTETDFKVAIPKLIKLSERRGCEAAGLAVACRNKISIYKQAVKPSLMVKSLGFGRFINSVIPPSLLGDAGQVVGPVAVIGHTRLVTNGSQAIPCNNQPISTDCIVGVHNGIIANDRDLLKLHPDLKKPSGSRLDSDTRIFFELINRYHKKEDDIEIAILKSYNEIIGSASVALFSDDSPNLILATNTGSLYYTYEKSGLFFVFASERNIIEQFLKKTTIPKTWSFESICSLSPFFGAIINFENMIPEIFSLNDARPRLKYNFHVKEKGFFEIADVSSPQKVLRCCTKCVLPETYPFISFDEEGVCNYCKDYKKQEFLGFAALEAILEKYRSKTSDPDCIVGFSGGRDSSYALHVLKKELGMHPIAYTYDWALVTDEARRNQARIVGKLGIDHLIRAADIHTKRRYIRKNIYAWLKRPKLGIVPLFMAGDKMFYYYGRQLRKETGIKLTIFASGYQLEQMEFKVGFCGIDQKLVNNTKLYNFDFISKIRLALWYVMQYLMNPAYINESLLDNIFAFYSSFINKDDYLYLYRYIPWNESRIERTLKEEYGWESFEKYGKNQWRMGDGHTALIDYIYYMVAGFSEFDNFRSNQIREGLITREEALELLQDDNRPRIEVLQDFSQLIGFNLEEVLLKINAIPKLY